MIIQLDIKRLIKISFFNICNSFFLHWISQFLSLTEISQLKLKILHRSTICYVGTDKK